MVTKKHTMQGYIELQETTDMIGLNGDEPVSAAELNGMPGFAIVNGGELYYPDLVITWQDEAPEALLNGNPVTVHELIGGQHPPQRPR